MFDWFWNFLYSISKGLMKICDNLMDVAMVLIGIDDMKVNGVSTDFLTYLITSEQVEWTFAAVVIMGFIVLCIFTIFSIIRNIAKDEPGMPPAKICVKSLKCLMMFVLVPAVMLTLVVFCNTFMKQLFVALQQGNQSTIGAFLFVTFADEAPESLKEAVLSQEYDPDETMIWHSVSEIEGYGYDISDFNFILSWICAGVVMYNIAGSLIMFVDRAISIIILYIAAPFSIAATVIDDGAHFKTWREQVLTKFLTAYGTIIAINIYILVIGLVTRDNVYFFSNGFLNYVAKVLITIGGAVTMRKSMTLVASLMSQGGAQDMNDPTVTAGRAFAGKVLGGALKYNPAGIALRALGSAAGRKINNMKEKLGNRMLNGLGINTDYDTNRLNGNMGGGAANTVQGSPNENNQQTQQNPEQQQLLKNALENNSEQNNGDNQNPNDPNQNKGKGQQIMNNAINNNNNNNNGEK